MNIVISYRRSDSEVIAGRIRDRLAARYGDDRVFLDINDIPFGSDFRRNIRDALSRSNVLIAIIGPQWLGGHGGERTRISDPADPVRIEIETALNGGISVIPLLVGNAQMPTTDELPDSLKAFAFINAAPVATGRDFHQHMDQLIRTLEKQDADAGAAASTPSRGVGAQIETRRFEMRPAEMRVDLLPDRHSIAVLPFQNLSGDPGQDYFADGMVEELITALSRMRGLFVIARNSSFAYRGRSVNVKQIGRELGVRYVLEGSVRKAANRVRITGQLIDTSTAAHLWADRFDGALDDIFDLQDQITSKVVGAIAPKLEKAEIERAKRKPTESLDAYDCCLRGLATFHHATREGIDEALRMFYRAIEIDPDFALPYGMAAWCYVHRKSNGWRSEREQDTAETARLAWLAADLGKDDATALALAAHALAYAVPESDIDAATGFAERAVVLNPNLATVRFCSGWIRIWRGEPEMAIEHVNHAIRLSPSDPTMFRMQNMLAMAHFLALRYDQASSWADRALYEQPAYVAALPIAATSHAQAGRIDVARKYMAALRRGAPWLCISNLADAVPFRQPEDFARYAEGLRIAGLPE
jgi:TolB-like protein